jgi:hypothetical protein
MKKGEECKLICRKDSGDHFRIFQAEFWVFRLFFFPCIAGKITPNALIKTHNYNELPSIREPRQHLFWASWANQRWRL